MRKRTSGRKNALTARVLRDIMDSRDWSQTILAKRAGIAPSVVSAQLSGNRTVRDEHLHGYLAVLDGVERRKLLAAWMWDSFEPAIVGDLLAQSRMKTKRLRSQVAEWGPELDVEQQQMLRWWGTELPRDSELDEVFRAITRRCGFPISA
jgi:hypothetical protein